MTAHRDAARRAARAAMRRRGWNVGEFAQATGVHPDTLSDFLNGVRWPQAKNQGRIEKALGWPDGAIADVEEGLLDPTLLGGDGNVAEENPGPEGEVDPRSVGARDDDDDPAGQGIGGPRRLSEFSLAELADEIRRRADEGP